MKNWLILIAILAMGAVSTFHGTGFRLEDRGTTYTIRTLAGTDLLRVDTNGRITLLDSEQITIASGSGSPNSAVTANPGSVYTNTSGGAGTTLYAKESGSGTNTGWVPVFADNLGNHTATTNLAMATFNLTNFGALDGSVFDVDSTGRVTQLDGETVMMASGSVTPQSNVTANPGSMYLRTSGGSGTTLYLKESGTGTNTGWVAVTSGGSDNLGAGSPGTHEAGITVQMNENSLHELAVLAFKTAVTLADGATITVSAAGSKTTVAKLGGTTMVDNIVGEPNQILVLIMDSGEAVEDNTGIQLKDNADFTATGLSTLTLYNDNNTSWYEIARTLLHPP